MRATRCRPSCAGSPAFESQQNMHMMSCLELRVRSWYFDQKGPLYGAKSGRELDLDKVLEGRQREMSLLYEHDVVEVTPNSQAVGGSHITGDWGPEDWKGDGVRCGFVAKQINYFKRDDVTQNTPPLKVFMAILSLCATKRKNSAELRVFAIWDISVAFYHAPMDELVYVHPKDKRLCPAGFCWRLNKAMNGTRRASFLFGKFVRDTLFEHGAEEVQIFPMTFHSDRFDYTLSVHGDDFGAEGPLAGILELERFLFERFLHRVVAVVMFYLGLLASEAERGVGSAGQANLFVTLSQFTVFLSHNIAELQNKCPIV